MREGAQRLHQRGTCGVSSQRANGAAHILQRLAGELAAFVTASARGVRWDGRSAAAASSWVFTTVR